MAPQQCAVLVLLCSALRALAIADTRCTLGQSIKCDVLVVAELFNATESNLVLRNIDYIYGTCFDFGQNHSVKAHVNLSDIECYNESTFIPEERYLVCLNKDKWDRCRVSSKTPILTAPRNMLKRGALIKRIKRQETGMFIFTF